MYPKFLESELDTNAFENMFIAALRQAQRNGGFQNPSFVLETMVDMRAVDSDAKICVRMSLQTVSAAYKTFVLKYVRVQRYSLSNVMLWTRIPLGSRSCDRIHC